MKNENVLTRGGCRKPRGLPSAIRFLALCSTPLFIISVMSGCASSLLNKDTSWVGVQRLEYVTQGAGSPTVVFNSNTDLDSWLVCCSHGQVGCLQIPW